MDNKTNDAVNDPYSPEEWEGIFKALQAPEPEKIKAWLRGASENYQWMKTGDLVFMPSRKAEHETWKSLHVHANDILVLFKGSKVGADEDPIPRINGFMQQKLTGLHLGEFLDFLKSLRDQAKFLAGTTPRRGPSPVRARRNYVWELGEIYYKVTKKEPTLIQSQNVSGEFYGPFFDFVEAALRPIDSHACSGIGGEIKKIIQLRTRLKN